MLPRFPMHLSAWLVATTVALAIVFATVTDARAQGSSADILDAVVRLGAPIPGLGASTRVVDGRRVPDMNPLVHTEYVDNFIGISQSAPAASEAADKVAKALTAVGFGIHGPDVTCGGAVVRR